MAIPLPRTYKNNYSFGDTINEIIATNKADKLARDLQTQKLNQDMVMETQRNMLALKMGDIGHQQKKELTYMQQAENQVDRDFNANLTSQMNNTKMNYGKYMFDRQELERTRQFLRSAELEENLIDKKHHNQVSMADHQLQNNISLNWEKVEMDKERAQNDFDAKLDFLEKAGPITADQTRVNKEIELEFIGKGIDQAFDKEKIQYHDREKWDTEFQANIAKSEMLKGYYESEQFDEKNDKAWSKQLGNWTSELIGQGFNVNEWNSDNTAGVYNLLSSKMHMIEQMMQSDPRGDKNPYLWNQLRTQVTSVDKMFRDAGMGSWGSWMSSVFGGNKYGKRIQDLLVKMQYMLSGQGQGAQQQQ